MKQFIILFKAAVPYFILGCIFLGIPSTVLAQTKTPSIKLISPNGGERWEANSIQTIKWESSNINKIKIEYSFSNGIVWHNIATLVDASAGYFLWSVPNIQIAEVLIKISDVANSSIYDINDNYFKIYIKNINKKKESPNQITSINGSAAVKIMPLGNSITEGDGIDSQQVGYRSKLFDLLESARYHFDFVGTQHSGISYSGNPDFDADHEGHGGYEVMPPSVNNGWNLGDNIWRHVSENSSSIDTAGHWFYFNHPDIILLHIGTNDLDHNGTNCYGTSGIKPANTIANDIHKILDTVKVFDPNISTFLAKIIYNSHSTVPATTLNNEIQIMYDNLSLPQRDNVKLVNMYDTLSYPEDFSPSKDSCDFIDLHPIESGYNKMAGKWFLALENYLPLLQLKVFLQGPYSGNGVMTTSLRNFNNNTTTIDLLPVISPYPDKKSVSYNIPDSVTDWIFLEIRDSTQKIIKSKSCFLSKHGYVIDPDGFSTNISLGISPGNYYIVVKHRNHLPVMSSFPVELDGLTTYDFTKDSTQASSPKTMVNLGNGVFGMVAGDNNNDGVISIGDYNNIAGNMSKTGYYIPDDNMDGIVTKSDYSLVEFNLFKYSIIQ